MRLFLAPLCGLLFLAGCSDSRTSSAERVKLTDSQMEDGIKSRFSADPDLARLNLDVDADADENKVTVSGTVPNESLRARALDIARNFQTGNIVDAKIDVKPTEVSRADYTEDMARETRERARTSGNTVGDSLDDAWIHTKITSKLATDGDTPATGINVDVNKNVVTLRGTVKSVTAKNEAERIARETDGVKQVKNALVVKAN